MPRFMIYFNVGDTCAILPPVVLFFHQDIHLVDGIHGAILIDVVGKGFAQSNEGNAALVKDGIAHN